MPDYWFIAAHDADVETFEKFAGEGGYDYYISRLLQTWICRNAMSNVSYELSKDEP